jgi:hypothetical protein
MDPDVGMRRVSRNGSGRATYLYCLVQRATMPPLARAPRGLPQTGPLRALPLGTRLWLVAADAPLARYGTEPIERGLRDLAWVSTCAMAHEAVIEHVAAKGTTVPMKLFTLFSSDERAVAHIRRLRPAVERLLRRLAGREEWGVRVTLDPARARRRLREDVEKATAGVSAGTRFLLVKQRERDAVRDAIASGLPEVDRVFETLAGLADDARRRPPDEGEAGARLLLDAALLVSARRRARFRTAVRAAAARLAERGCELTLTGPWPPYNFVGKLA